MNINRLKLVTFDVTDTLLHFRSNLGQQYSKMGESHGVLCDEKLLAASFKQNWIEMKREYPNFGKTAGIGWVQWWKIIVARTFKNVDSSIADNKLDLISTHLIEMYKSADSWKCVSGTIEILQYLQKHQKTLGIISNFDERLPVLLENIKLKNYFNFILCSYEAGFEKPDTRIFESAMKSSNITGLKVEECLHIGNTPALDYIGAKDSGWHAALISGKKLDNNCDIDPNHVYNTLYDLYVKFIDCNKNEIKLK